MTLEEIHPAIVAFVAAATGLSEPMIALENGDRSFIDPADPRYCLIAYGQPVALGVDQITYEANEEEPLKVDTVIRGTRQMVATLAFESFDQTPDRSALVDAHRLINRWRMPSVRGPLSDAGIAVVGFTPPSSEDYEVDDHWISRYTLDFTFAFGIEERPSAAVAPDTIETIGTIEVSSETTDPNGDALPAALQLSEEITDEP